jgi:hypothetical protein
MKQILSIFWAVSIFCVYPRSQSRTPRVGLGKVILFSAHLRRRIGFLCASPKTAFSLALEGQSLIPCVTFAKTAAHCGSLTFPAFPVSGFDCHKPVPTVALTEGESHDRKSFLQIDLLPWADAFH